MIDQSINLLKAKGPIGHLHRSKITTPTPHHSIFTGRMVFLTPNKRCQTTEGTFSFQLTHFQCMSFQEHNNNNKWRLRVWTLATYTALKTMATRAALSLSTTNDLNNRL